MKVSVVLTSYNHEQYISQSIQSILEQTYSDFELIIYDDGSTDGSLDVIKKFSDSRIRVIENGTNRGSGVIEFILSNNDVCEYVAIAHSDDVWDKNKLAKQVQYLDEHEDVAAVFTKVRVIDELGNDYAEKEGFYYDVFDVENRTRFKWLNHFFYFGNCLCHPSVMIRKKAYFQYNLFPKALRQIPDFYMWVRLCLFKDIYIIDEKLTFFRVRKHQENTSGFRKDTSVRSSLEYYVVLKQYLGIPDYDDFIEVFPNAKQYVTKSNFNTEYAFARICIEKDRPEFVKAFGFQLLYNLFNNVKYNKLLISEYKFNYKDFFELSGMYDIYHVFPVINIENANIYFDFGNGFSEKYVCRKEYNVICSSQRIILEFKYNIHDNVVKNIRFDPIENKFIRCRIISFLLNRKKMEISPVNAFSISEHSELFITGDPQYLVLFSDSVVEDDIVIEVEFELSYLEATEITMLQENRLNDVLINSEKNINLLNEHNNKLQDLNNELQTQNTELQTQNTELQTQNTELYTQNEVLQSQYANLLNKYNNKLSEKIKRGLKL